MGGRAALGEAGAWCGDGMCIMHTDMPCLLEVTITHWPAGMDPIGATVSQYVLLHSHAPLLSSAHGRSDCATAQCSPAHAGQRVAAAHSNKRTADGCAAQIAQEYNFHEPRVCI